MSILTSYKLEKSIKNLKRYPYIKDVNIKTNINDQLADIIIDVSMKKLKLVIFF